MKKSRKRKSTPRLRPAIVPRRHTLALCVIARDEERFIADCLASAQPFVDQIVVLDTGSTDATPEIARRFGADVGTFEWQDDFAAARNAAIALATCDWILMLDADERLQPASGPPLRAFIESNPSDPAYYAPRVENLQSEDPQDFHVSFPNRLFQRRSDVAYIGAIHEDLFYLPDPAQMRGLRLNFIRITHLGYKPDIIEARGKFDRNRRLLLRESVARPDDPLPWYYLGMDQLSADDPAAAAAYLRQSLACSGNRPGWSRIDVYTYLISAYVQLNDTERLQRIADEAERAGELSANARTRLSHWLIDRGQYTDAVRHLLAALEPEQPPDSLRERGVGGWSTRVDLARTYEHMGDPAAALLQIELGLDDPELHERAALASTAVRLAAEVGDMASVSRHLKDVPEPGDDDLEGHLRLLEFRSLAGAVGGTLGVFDPIDSSIARGDWQSAYDAALALSGMTMAEAARLLFVAGRLKSGGAPEAALNLLVHLHDTQPALPQLHALLTIVLADLGRYDDALAANEVLQMLMRPPTAA